MESGEKDHYVSLFVSVSECETDGVIKKVLTGTPFTESFHKIS